MVKALLRVLGGIFAVIFLITAVGLFLPPTHVAAVQARYDAERPEVWSELADMESWADWNTMIDTMQALPDIDGQEAWLATGSVGELPTVVTLREAPGRLETSVDGGVFTGTWTYELDGLEDGTLVTITERGEIAIPPFRLFMLFNDPHESARTFLRDLGTRLGEDVTPEPVSS